jgi:superfamily II DNA or RNA helicase
MDSLQLFVDNASTQISGNLRGELYKEFKRHLGYQPEDALWRMQNNPHWDGYISTVCWNRQHCRCAIKRDGVHFPTGLISLAMDFFRDKEVPFSVIDVRDHLVAKSFREIPYHLTDALVVRDEKGNILKNEDGSFVKGKPFAPYGYQNDGIQKAIAQQRGILKLATGAGKTVLASGIIAELGVIPAIFYVTSTDLLKQAYDEFTQYIRLNNMPVKIGRVGGGYKDIQDITVMTVQTAVRALDGKWKKYDEEDENDNTDISDIKADIAELIQNAKLIIFDECQHVAADTCQIIADSSLNARWRYGLSATPWRDKGDDMLIDACFGKQIIDINASWLIKEGFLVKPNIAFIKMDNLKGERLGAYPSVYKTAIVENTYRNTVIAQLAQNLVDQGRCVLVLVQQIAHGETLQEMIPDSVFLHGSCSKKTREKHIELMRTGHAPVTIASTIFDEGIDVKPLNALILAGGGKSPTRALQRIGRVIRQYTYPDGIKKSDAYVYDFYDHQKYLSQHASSRRKIYKSEPEFVIEDFNL